jgi:predicted  nucleic acid-binding Zn-ribbon protein
MSSTIEQRVDNDLNPTRENDMSSKRDVVPKSDGDSSTKATNGSESFRGKQKQQEYQHHNDASLQKKALLEQFLNEYDIQHQEEKKMLQKNIYELQDETDWYKNHFSNKLLSVKDMVDCRFDDVRTLMEDLIENEQEERIAAFQEIEEQLILRDEEVDGLLKVIAKQSDELKQAKLEREELKKEMKSILVTLHVQFERFEEKIFKSEAEVTLLREDHKVDNEVVFGDIEKIKECMAMFQKHINEVKLEGDAHFQKTNNQIALAQRENQDHLQKMIDEQQNIVSEYISLQKNELENINSNVKIVLLKQEKYSKFQDEIDRRFDETKEKSRNIESSLSKQRSLLDDVKNTVFNGTAAAMENIHSKEVEILNKLDVLTDQVLNVEQNFSELSKNYNSLKMDKESDSMKWKRGFEMIEVRLQKQESIVTTDINSVKQNLKAVVELLSSKLTDLRIEVNSTLISQKSVNNELKCQHSSHEEKLYNLDEAVQATKREIAGMIDQIKEHHNRYENVTSQIVQVQENHEATRYEHQLNTDALSKKYDGLKQTIQQNSEAQSLANKDFKMKQSGFEEKIKSCSSNVNSLEQRLIHAESCLNTSVSPDLVDVMLQPYIKQNDAIGGHMKKQAEDLKKLKDQIKGSQLDRTALTEKIESMNKTWESLFQHLVGQVTKDTVDMDALKKENENVLNDMKGLATSLENRLVAVIAEQVDFKESASMVLFLRTNMEKCNHRVSCLADEMESHRVINSSLLEQKSSLDTALKNLKEDMESVADKSLLSQKNLISDQMAKMLLETDLKIQNVIKAYTEEFARTNQRTQEAWEAIKELKEIVAACEQTVHSEISLPRRNLTVRQFEALGLGLKLQATKESTVPGENQN